MKALISAAGMGVRMGKLTKNTNKCALEINGIPIIQRLVTSLRDLSDDEIYVVVGYKKQEIMSILGNQVNYLDNDKFETTGILTSILKAKEYLSCSDFIFMTGDSIFHPKIIENIINSKTSEDILISVEKKLCNEEDCKVVLKDNKIIQISKKADPTESVGEFTSLTRVNEKISKVFFEKIEGLIKENDEGKILGDVLVIMDSMGYNVSTIYTDHYYRTEIDFDYDLERAKDLILE